MVKVSDYVVYNHDVCKVIDFNIFNGKDYYFFNSLSDSSLTKQPKNSPIF